MDTKTLKPELPPCPECGGEMEFTELDGQHMSIYCIEEDCSFSRSAGPDELGPLFESAAMHYLVLQVGKAAGEAR